MFFSLFESRNQKLVRKWQKEHVLIVKLATDIITEYQNGHRDKAKNSLQKLSVLTVDHIMEEDLNFYTLLRKNPNMDSKTKILLKDFIESFKGTKMVLINFLEMYAYSKKELNDRFLREFNNIVGVVAKRIEFEESNLYIELNK